MIKNHITNDLEMVPCVSNLLPYVKNTNGILVCMTGSCVDDGLNCSTPEFEQLAEHTTLAFECKERKYGDLSFFGTLIHTVGENEFLLSQKHYCAGLWKLPLTAPIEDLRRLRALLAWRAHIHTSTAGLACK